MYLATCQSKEAKGESKELKELKVVASGLDGGRDWDRGEKKVRRTGAEEVFFCLIVNIGLLSSAAP